MKLKFLGAAHTVTGSKTALTLGDTQILIDCGMYQGTEEVTGFNLEKLDIEIKKLDYIFLTHAHYDHCGYLPVLISAGFRGKILCSEITKKLVQVVLEDSVKIQEFNKKQKKIDEVLYTAIDVQKTMSLFETKKNDQTYSINNFSYRFYEAGHILGAISIVFTFKGKTICFSGDLGRGKDILHKSPNFPKDIDFLVIESTYGNRIHSNVNALDSLAEQVKRIKDSKGVLLIPTFAIARTQVMMVLLHRLFKNVPGLEIPIYLDSPMGIRATKIYEENVSSLKISEEEFVKALNSIKTIEFGHDLKKIKKEKGPFIILSSSGMITGGKVLKYFDMYAKHEKNTILLVGYQAEGTIGRKILDGDLEVRLFGHTINVRASIQQLESMSAHADKIELRNMILSAGDQLKSIYLNHGEDLALNEFKTYLEKETSINIEIARKNTVIVFDE